MSSNDVLDFLRGWIALPAAAFWPALAWMLDAVRQIGGVAAGLIALLLLAVPAAFASALQQSLNGALERQPRRSLGGLELLKMDLWCSVFCLPLWPFRLLATGARAAARGVARLVRRLRRRAPEVPEAPAEAGKPAPEPPEPLLVATLGPAYLFAGVATVGLYLLARLVAPLLRAELGLSPDLSPWQYLALGRRPELAWYLPLERFPFLAGLLAIAFWVAVWSLAGMLLRQAWRKQIGRNLAGERGDAGILPAWRRWCGASTLAAPDRSYLEWAAWPVLAAVPLLAWAWFSLAGDPYRIPFSDFAVGSLLWTSWGLHLVLRGRDRRIEEPRQAEAGETEAKGWLDVLAWLADERQLVLPEPFEERDAEPLPFSEMDPRTAGFLSPLVLNLLPEPRKLTTMQRIVLTQLALQGYVHVDPPVDLEHLSLGEDVLDVLQDLSGQRSRNQIVLAPEGTGKTSLALLAAANHALVHTRATLLVVRDEARAHELAERFRRILDPSPLRWNVRLRQLGSDLMNDLSQGIVPDLMVCGLEGLVLTVLDRPDTFAPFLRNLGLIVVDDVESFAGPVEVHAQLAFRRLGLRVGELMGIDELGDEKEKGAPQVLVLGAEAMHDMPKWARALCGIDAVFRPFTRMAREAKEREAAEMAARGVAAPAAGEEEAEQGDGAPATEAPPALHRFYRLRDLRTAGGESLGLDDVIAACERLAVPWHYRLCGDGRRELGRGPLLLREEPLHFVSDPAEVCVVFLEGAWSEVRREWQRLTRAGCRFSRFRRAGGEMVQREGGPPEAIAFLTLADPDLEMAFTQLDKGFSLAPALDALPRPVLRPPTGLAVAPHLSADLSRHWIEVADLLEVFGTPAASTLRRLSRNGLLLGEPRTDVKDRANEYAQKLYVRALARAVRPAGGEEGPEGPDAVLLPPKVAQVEVAARRLVAVRDRTDLTLLGWADDTSAHLTAYPGRIFKDARGTFVVVGRAGEEAGAGAEPQANGPGGASKGEPEVGEGDVLVEPLLSDEVSSPRRRFRVESLRRHAETAELLEAAGGSFPEPNLVLIGRQPFTLTLDPVGVSVEHVATYRLGPVHCEVRQRAILDPETRRHLRDRPLTTLALGIFPNPEEAGEPALALEPARVLAAALRALLPSMYRGAGGSLGVALHLDRDSQEPGPDHVLGPREGIYLFDADPVGNGFARAIHREGVDLLLRLSRLLVERVLSLGRLRALHDEWGSQAEILAESEADGEGGSSDEEVRRALLQWLDSRLRPEGGLEAVRTSAESRGGSEAGEGDPFDLGRCWYSRDGSTADLLWAKHRWRRPGGRGEVMLDVGFDRETEAEARVLARDPGRLGPSLEAYDALLASRAARLPEGRSRHAPREVWSLPAGEATPRIAREGLKAEGLRELHARALAAMGLASPAVAPLAAFLAERAGSLESGQGGADASGLLRSFAAFVQGIPFSEAGEPLASPVTTLLHRTGGTAGKALLLALLFRARGLEAGLFHSTAGEGTLVAAPLSDLVLPSTGGTPEERAIEALRRLESWSANAGLAAPPALWAELPSSAGGAQLFVPVPVRSYGEVGRVRVERPEAWVFLPLSDERPGRPEEEAHPVEEAKDEEI